MQATKQQQILGYFIEEAKEHLDTIEQGLLKLKETMADSERLNELFRAAHSVKGGAAMLGFGSIQKVSHHLEDCFKILKEHPAVDIDQAIENLFFKGFDVLKELVEELQSPYGLREEDAAQKVQALDPVFTELQNSLNGKLGGAAAPSQPAPAAQPAGRSPAEISALLNGALKKMLELFKQGDSPANRQQIAAFCGKLVQLHSSPEWRKVLELSQKAIANPRSPYQHLPSVVIKELKQSGDLLVAGRSSEITPGKLLLQLAGVPAAPATPAATQPAAPAPAQPTGKPQQITIPAEPRAAARVLLQSFNKAQLIELAEYLMKAIQ